MPPAKQPARRGTPAARTKEEELRAAFNVFDEDNSGALSLEELRAAHKRERAEFKAMFNLTLS